MYLEGLDFDEDGQVSWADWKSSLKAATDSLPVIAFHQVILGLTQAMSQQINMDANPDAVHPVNNSGYMAASLGEQLQQGLAAVLAQMQDRHTVIASKQLWASDGYLPDKYVPERPIRMLGEWLRDNCSASCAGAQDAAAELDWSCEIPWASLSLDRKVEAAFQHLETGDRGCAFARIDLQPSKV